MTKFLSNGRLHNRILLVLLTACVGFILLLFFFNQTPVSLIKLIFQKAGIETEFYDTTDLYNFSKPADHMDIINKILEAVEKSDTGLSQKNDTGQDVTQQFRSYAANSENFANLSNIITTWDNKYLAFNNSKLFLFQIEGNKIYLRTLNVPEIEKIEFAYIFKSGNILFCDSKNAYYSHDNLLTFHKSNILDVDGNQYSANDHGSFFSLCIDDRQIINGKEVRVWGNYTNYGQWQPGASRSEQVQVFYTIDEGVTIKVAYKFGFSRPELSSRHVHAVNMCPWDNSFWVQTGDGVNECHWMQGKYDWENDTWNWNLVASGDELSFSKSTGFVFHDGFVFWSDDSSDPKKHGIWKTPYSNLVSNDIDTMLFEKALDIDKEIAMLVGNREGLMIASQYFKSADNRYKVFLSNDAGLTWQTINTSFQIANLHPPNRFGHLLGNYFVNQETFEAMHYWNMSPSILINSYMSNTKEPERKQ